MKAKGYELITKNIAFEKIKYNEKIFNKLCVTKDDEVFKIARLRIVEGRSVAIHTSYVAKSVFNDIDKYGNCILSMFEYYKQHGYNSFKSSISVLSVSIPSSEERKNLECSKRTPVIILETDCIDTDSKVVLEYTKILYRGDCFKYNLM